MDSNQNWYKDEPFCVSSFSSIGVRICVLWPKMQSVWNEGLRNEKKILLAHI